MQLSNARRHQHGPPARATAKVESLGGGRQFVERKRREILIEHQLLLGRRERALVEGSPFASEIINGEPIDILHCVALLIADNLSSRAQQSRSSEQTIARSNAGRQVRHSRSQTAF